VRKNSWNAHFGLASLCLIHVGAWIFGTWFSWKRNEWSQAQEKPRMKFVAEAKSISEKLNENNRALFARSDLN